VSEVYVSPEDVSQADALKVLAFLNAAQTPEHIAETVEFPDELDVGIRVAQRLLDRRQELGAFTSLQQVADVPQVGPERFTEIVVALSGLGAPGRAVDTALHLMQEIRTLRETVEALQSTLGARRRVTLHPIEDHPFLGQPVTIVATVTDALGTAPQVDMPVTFATTWGRLRSVGLLVQQGNTVTARTNAAGTAKVTLLPPTSEDLWERQQGALETMLRLLDADAATPLETRSGLEEMVRRYDWEANVDFRRAVDIYFRDLSHHLLDTINQYDYMRSWSYFDATVMAFARDDAGGDAPGTTVQSTASLTLRFKDWLGPWLETYQAEFESQNALENELQHARQRTEEAGALVQDVYGRVRDFVADQRGLVGEYAGRKVAGTSLDRFIASELGDLPPETRVNLFPALKVAADTIDTAGVKVLSAVGQTHSNLRQELNQKIATVETKGIGALSTRVEDLQSQLNAKVDATTFNTALISKLDASEFNNFVSEYNSFETEVGTQLAAKVDTTTFNTALARKVDTTTFNTQVGSLQNRVNRFDVLLPPDQ
jgi:hypothetical protein